MLHAVADTHTIIWYLFADARLSATAKSAIEEAAGTGNQVAFSSITLAEIVYLGEKGRIHQDTLMRVLDAVEHEHTVLYEIPFDRHVAQTLSRVDRLQIPDLPDCMIAATALYHNLPLISRDRRIRLSSIPTIW